MEILFSSIQWQTMCQDAGIWFCWPKDFAIFVRNLGPEDPTPEFLSNSLFFVTSLRTPIWRSWTRSWSGSWSSSTISIFSWWFFWRFFWRCRRSPVKEPPENHIVSCYIFDNLCCNFYFQQRQKYLNVTKNLWQSFGIIKANKGLSISQRTFLGI